MNPGGACNLPTDVAIELILNLSMSMRIRPICNSLHTTNALGLAGLVQAPGDQSSTRLIWHQVHLYNVKVDSSSDAQLYTGHYLVCYIMRKRMLHQRTQLGQVPVYTLGSAMTKLRGCRLAPCRVAAALTAGALRSCLALCRLDSRCTVEPRSPAIGCRARVNLLPLADTLPEPVLHLARLLRLKWRGWALGAAPPAYYCGNAATQPFARCFAGGIKALSAGARACL
jgi:hypothetical protein